MLDEQDFYYDFMVTYTSDGVFCDDYMASEDEAIGFAVYLTSEGFASSVAIWHLDSESLEYVRKSVVGPPL